MRSGTRDGSFWANTIIPLPPPAPVPTARSATKGALQGAFGHARPPDPVAEEIRRLQSLASQGSARIRTAEESNEAIPELIHLIESGGLDPTALSPVIDAVLRNDRLLPALAGLASMDRLAHAVRKWRRRQALLDFREAVTGGARADAELPGILRKESWMFGGTLVHLPGLDEIPGLADTVIPLRRFDEALHLALVGPARVGDLLSPDGTGYRLSGVVTEACDRARHVVRELTARQAGAPLYANGERPYVTVIVGHPRWVVDGPDSRTIHDEMRVYNTFLAGLNVITYAELLSMAEHMLDIDNPYGDVPGEPEDAGRDLRT